MFYADFAAYPRGFTAETRRTLGFRWRVLINRRTLCRTRVLRRTGWAAKKGAVKNLVSDTTRETEVIVVIDLAFREMVSDTKFFTAPKEGREDAEKISLYFLVPVKQVLCSEDARETA